VRFRIATLFGLFLTGTFFEEVFYRGYLTERMTVLTKHRWATAYDVVLITEGKDEKIAMKNRIRFGDILSQETLVGVPREEAIKLVE